MILDFAKAKNIFLDALEKSDAGRIAFLVEACDSNANLRRHVDQLLDAHKQSCAFFDNEALAVNPTMDCARLETVGTQIGPYKLLEQIGEGGMGVVYVAEQSKPIRRRVALKIIKPGMDSRQVIARFEAERQTLAIMDHPNIAKVLDAGTTEAGLPYFVMELVKGTPITEFCDAQKLTTRERLKLFAALCQAVQHAHQKGIIHRDIKPSNVLVEVHDVVPVPKVIDFGVAKAMGQQLSDKTLYTGFAQMVGTPLYMSPEQAGQSSIDIDTRSDVYSLGVLLYELLTGSTPFESETLRKAGYDEMRRIIREVDPPRPSARVNTLQLQALSTVSDCRKIEPKKLSQQLRGELDWIVMKSLEKDRNRRYESASSLVDDVERFLNDETVLACPPSARYRIQKFARRNKVPVVAASLIVFALVVGVIGTSWGIVRAEKAKARAIAAESARKLAQETAEERQAESEAILEFVEKHVFAAVMPESQKGGLGYSITLREALEAALPAIQESFSMRPRVEAQLRMTIGRSFAELGDLEAAAEQFEAARTLYERISGPTDTDTLASMDNLATCFRLLGKHAEALLLHEETLASLIVMFGSDDIRTLGCKVNLAIDYSNVGRHEEALRLEESTLAVLREKFPDHDFTHNCMNNLAILYATLGRYGEAVELHQQTLAAFKAKLGEDHTDTTQCMSALAKTYSAMGQYADAVDLQELSLSIRKSELGKDHPLTLSNMESLAESYAALERYDDALKLDEQALELTLAKFGPTHRKTISSINNLAVSYYDSERYEEALELNKKVLENRIAELGHENDSTLSTMHNLANCYAALVRQAEALKIREQVLERRRAILAPDHVNVLKSLINLAHSYSACGRDADAVKLVEEALAIRQKKLAGNHPDTVENLNELAWILANCPDEEVRNPTRAVELAEQAVEQSSADGEFWNTLGVAQYRAGEWKEAIKSLNESMRLDSVGDSTAWFFLAMAHWQLEQKVEARKWYDQAVEWMDKNKPQDVELLRFRAEASELLDIDDTPR